MEFSTGSARGAAGPELEKVEPPGTAEKFTAGNRVAGEDHDMSAGDYVSLLSPER
jgi:hypothetical protein